MKIKGKETCFNIGSNIFTERRIEPPGDVSFACFCFSFWVCRYKDRLRRSSGTLLLALSTYALLLAVYLEYISMYYDNMNSYPTSHSL